MKLYKITYKDGKQTFLELQEGSIEELSQEVELNNIKSIELVFEGSSEETSLERTRLIGEFERQLEIIKTISSQSLKTLEDLPKEPLEIATIVDALLEHFKKLEDIYEKYTELLIFQEV